MVGKGKAPAGRTVSDERVRTRVGDPSLSRRYDEYVAKLGVTRKAADVLAGDDELVAITLAAARGEVSAEALSIWLRQRTRRREG